MSFAFTSHIESALSTSTPTTPRWHSLSFSAKASISAPYTSSLLVLLLGAHQRYLHHRHFTPDQNFAPNHLCIFFIVCPLLWPGNIWTMNQRHSSVFRKVEEVRVALPQWREPHGPGQQLQNSNYGQSFLYNAVSSFGRSWPNAGQMII